jgi:heme-degrading monooxygenase HmoA
MIAILARAAVEGLPKFIGMFGTRGADMRRKHGGLGSTVFRDLDQENRVTILLEWESREAFEGFLNDPAVKETMQSAQSAGTVGRPEFTFLEEVGAFPS